MGTQIVRHGWAIGFVLRIHVIAKGFTLGIEYYRHVIGVEILAQADQHIEYAFDGARGLAFGGGQRWQGMEGAIQVGRSVDKYQGLFGRHGVHFFNENFESKQKACWILH